ncbi:MAG: hypothetical protein FWE67_09480, partial [Planctomycetaceae bacterium]|nr:hypothetical protein [Planctomycetaceae bacterium]
KADKVDFNGKTHEEWAASGKDIGGIVADPKFVDAKNRDFRLKDDSPAKQIGFVPFDFSKAGVYGSEKWIERAKKFVTPIHPTVAPLPPFKLIDGFEAPRGTPLKKGVASDEGKNLIRLSKDNPASGEQCLEVVYAPGLRATFNPHFHYDPRYDQGRVRIAFSLRMQENSEVDCELRDKSSPYKVGPRFRASKGKLQLEGGQPPIPYPVNEWVRYEITAGIGDKSTGDWNLCLTFADGTKKEFKNLKFRHADWKSLYWFGFSNCVRTTEQTVYYLDDIVIANE